MTVKELEAAFTAAAENTMQKAEALGLDSAPLRAQCEKHGAAACLKRCIQRGQEVPSPGSSLPLVRPACAWKPWQWRAALPSSSPMRRSMPTWNA